MGQLSSAERLEVREIFFESSTRKDFASEEERESFYRKYVGIYFERFPQFAFAAKGERVLGYIVGAPQSHLPELMAIQPHLKSFETYFRDFPAHLHINCHSEARGLGVGSQLTEHLMARFQEANIKGLHIMTGPESRNKNFYQKLGFDFEVTLTYSGNPILMMGKSLGPKPKDK